MFRVYRLYLRMAHLGGVLDIFWLTRIIEWGAGDAASLPADGGIHPSSHICTAIQCPWGVILWVN